MSSIKKRAIRGGLWTLIGYGLQNVIRLGSNLVLTRILFPEAFGLMSLVTTFLIGLEMFSDVGIVPSIIQNKRGDEPSFLNTAWTVQSIRGVMLWIGACILAIPAAQFYREPMLAQILPASGLAAILGGLNSTKLATANRNLNLGRVTVIDIAAYVTGLTITITLAWIYKSVWALVIGNLIGSAMKTILSHVALEGENNRFHWDAEALASLSRFGRWIFINTILGFLVFQGDRLLLGRLLDVRFLGIYSIALNLSALAQTLIAELSNKVLFAAYAEVFRETPERLYAVLKKNRRLLGVAGLGFTLFFVLFGEKLIDLLYDDRYFEAGWMLQVLAIGMLVRSLNQTYTEVLMATDQAFVITGLIASNVVILFVAMIVGAQLGGSHGVVIGIAATEWLLYPVQSFMLARLSLWQPQVDLPFIGMGVLLAAYIYFA